MELYGNPGTAEGRRRGGLASLITHNNSNTDFITLKEVRIPKRSELLAEFLGILIGDGHLSTSQAGVTTNSLTDFQHAHFFRETFNKLFGIKSKLTMRSGDNSVSVVASSRNLVQFLRKQGMPLGNKIKNGLRVPNWILRKTAFQKAFIRGLFDTDGCVYIDRHNAKGKTYFHGGWTITSYADTLRRNVTNILENLGFSPTCRDSQKSVYLRKQKDIQKYFFDIGTNNPKHRNRYQRFTGGVPKWS